jgi:hypothetical protein
MNRHRWRTRLLVCVVVAGILTASMAVALRTRRNLVNYRSTGGWTFRVYMPQRSNAVNFVAGWPIGQAVDETHLDQGSPPPRAPRDESTGEYTEKVVERYGVQIGHARESPNLVLLRMLAQRPGGMSAADRGLFARPHRYALVALPFPVLIIVFVLLTFLPVGIGWLRDWKAGRRGTSQPMCASCGYDMRSTPARCPECGQPRQEPRAAPRS